MTETNTDQNSRKAEQQLILSRKMEALGRLASGIAHEINTPMQYLSDNTTFLKSALAGLIELQSLYRRFLGKIRQGEPLNTADWNTLDHLEKKVDPAYLENETQRTIEQSLEGVDRVISIVLALKDFARPSYHGPALADINRGIQNTVTICRREWKYVAEMHLHLEDPPPLVFCLLDEINQVLLNLIVNAAHAVKTKIDTGVYDLGNIEIRTCTNDTTCIIEVTDDGSGIAPEHLARVFEPFFTTKAVGQGSGQGLAICRDIVENKHRGAITLATRPGKGTTFKISLPLRAPDSTAPAEPLPDTSNPIARDE
jgi:signal transduction histidine kinase